MIRKYVIKSIAIILTFLLFSVTAGDMYIKTVGNTDASPDHKQINELLQPVSELYPRNKNLRVMSYNLLADSLGFEGSNAKSRANGVFNVLETFEPSVVALQEVSRRWYACIVNNTSYKFVHPLRTGVLGTMTAIIYNPLALTLLYSGELSFNSGNSSPLRRMVWAIFKDKQTKKNFVFLSTHLSIPEAESSEIPLLQALELSELCKKIENILKIPIIIAGDFNSTVSTKKTPSPVYDVLSSRFYHALTQSKTLVTLNETSNHNPKDHIFYTGSISPVFYAVLSHNSLKLLSDHYPVFADFDFLM